MHLAFHHHFIDDTRARLQFIGSFRMHIEGERSLQYQAKISLRRCFLYHCAPIETVYLCSLLVHVQALPYAVLAIE